MKIRLLAATLALGIGMSVAGCSSHPGVAAKFGDHQITERDLTAVVEEYHEVFGVNANPQAVLSVLIAEPVIAEVAATRNLTITDGELDKLIAGIQEQQKLQGIDSVPLSEVSHSDEIRQVLRAAQLLSPNYLVSANPNEFTEAGFNAYMQEFSAKLISLDPQINPRYGTFSMPSIVGPTSYPWITAVEDDPAATPPGQSGTPQPE